MGCTRRLKPPVAILVYPADEPRRAVYFPLAVFSPEWQTLVWAPTNSVPVRFMDLPQSHQLALQKAEEDQARTAKTREEQDDGAGARRSNGTVGGRRCSEQSIPRKPRPGRPTRWRSWPRPPATRTTNSGGKTRSSAAPMRRDSSPRSTRR